MKLIGNILWFVFGGFIWSILLYIVGFLFMITIIGIPISTQIFKMARFVMWPFNKKVVFNGGITKSLINIVWAVLFGWEFALGFLCTGALWCVTIVGIPFGLQYFKLALYVLTPLGMKFK